MASIADFIVVGAGPAGLLTALGLARATASVLVLKGAGQLNDSPRAMTCTDPTPQRMNRLGILNAAEAVGIRNRQINFVWPSDDLVITIDTVKAEPDRSYPHNLQFGQEALGAIAMQTFLTYPGSEVRINPKVKALRQGPASRPCVKAPTTPPSRWKLPTTAPTNCRAGHPAACMNARRRPATWAASCWRATPPTSATPAAGAA